MAAQIDTSNNRHNIAFIGETPWHGHGERLEPGAGLDVWCERAGLTHNVIKVPTYIDGPDGEKLEVAGSKALVRDDTYKVLSMVGNDYKIVQPREVIEFYRSLVENEGMQMETAGSLQGGRKVWALARTGEEASIKGRDVVRQYVLFATGYDRRMASAVAQTAIRVVCNNTFSLAIGENGERADVRVPHCSVFNADKIKAQMGLETNAWSEYIYKARTMADRKVTPDEMIKYFVELFYGRMDEVDLTNKLVERKLAKIVNIYQHAVGQDILGAANTAWGLHNAVTRFMDYENAERSAGGRLNNAWFGKGVAVKQKSFDMALKLAA